MVSFRAVFGGTVLFLFLALCTLLQLVSSDDIIWYQGAGDYYYTSNEYAWQGTTDGKSAPELLIASVINQPWLVAISKTNNIIYWTDKSGIIGAWNITSRKTSIVYRFDIGNWNEIFDGPALTGLDLDEANNHLYFTFNRSIYRLDLSQANPSSSLIASYNNLVFNPRFSASRNSLFFCIQNNFNQQSDLVQVSLSDPSTVTTLVHNTSTGSIVQQLLIDETANTLYYNSPGTLTMRGVSLTAPYNEVFKSINLNTNPTFFDFNPTTSAFVFGNMKFDSVYTWSSGSTNQPTSMYNPSYGKVTGVKFFNDTHALFAFQYKDNYPIPNEGYLAFVNINTSNDPSVLLHNFGMGTSLIFDEKYCDFYYVANVQNRTTTRYLEHQVIIRKGINEDRVDAYQSYPNIPDYNRIAGIALDANKRNLIVSRTTAEYLNSISYAPIDQPNANPTTIVDSRGRSISSYTVNEKTGDIYYTSYEASEYNLYKLDASAITENWVNNVGHCIVEGLGRLASPMTIDSVHNKLYFTNSSTNSTNIQVLQSNLDGSNITTIYTTNSWGIESMKWDPSSNRLFFLNQPMQGWTMVSMNGDGSNVVTTPLNAPRDSRRLFSQINPDPFSDWIYMSTFTQPMRIKKDGSLQESLYSYYHINSLGSIAFDESSGNIYYGDTETTDIKKININNVDKNDPAATNFEVVWEGDYNAFKLQSFILDKTNKVFWTLQNDLSVGYPYDVHTLSMVPINGGAAKQLYNFPKGVHYPWTINDAQGKLYTFSYDLTSNQQTPTTLVMMDLYNGSNLVTLLNFTFSGDPFATPTAMTIDPKTGLLYYTLFGWQGAMLESFDPVTLTTKRLWSSSSNTGIQDIKLNGTSIFMAGHKSPLLVYDINTGYVRAMKNSDYPIVVAVDPMSDKIYLGSDSIRSMSANAVNGNSTILLSTFTINGLTFDFAKKTAYFSLRNTSGKPLSTLPHMYQSDLDGNNKKKIQLQNSWYVPGELGEIKFLADKLYVESLTGVYRDSLDVFNVDGSGYERIIQGTSITGMITYNEASQYVYWLERTRFYGCAVYSADCLAISMFPQLQHDVPTFTSFFVADNGMVYLSSDGTIYSLDLTQRAPSIQVLVEDQRLRDANSIAMNKKQSELFVLTKSNVLRISVGTITTLYSNVIDIVLSDSQHLLVADLTHCK